jgi:hypothetical protein
MTAVQGLRRPAATVGNGESRARGPGSRGFGSPTESTDDTPAKRLDAALILAADDDMPGEGELLDASGLLDCGWQ